MFRYLDEQAYRYNYRKDSDAERFEMALGRAPGRRVTWAELTDKTPRQEPGYQMTFPWGKPRNFPMGPF